MNPMATVGLFDGLFDDAAIFPPGDLPLTAAVPAHLRHRAAPYGGLVGSLVLPAAALPALAPMVAGLPRRTLGVSVTMTLPGMTDVLDAVATMPAVWLAGLEVVVPEESDPADVLPLLDQMAAIRQIPIYVEVPRDDRRERFVAALRGTRCLAKLRTGGVRADLHPGAEELATAVVALVRAGVAFKTTAGLHHALPTTDLVTGFEQHGFLNVMVAVAVARRGAAATSVADVLRTRQPDPILAEVRRLDPAVRASFRSIGTCSIHEPVDDLHALGLLRASPQMLGA